MLQVGMEGGTVSTSLEVFNKVRHTSATGNKKRIAYIHQNICINMSITALFLIAQTGNNQMPSTGEWIKALCYMRPTQIYFTVESNKPLLTQHDESQKS